MGIPLRAIGPDVRTSIGVGTFVGIKMGEDILGEALEAMLTERLHLECKQ